MPRCQGQVTASRGRGPLAKPTLPAQLPPLPEKQNWESWVAAGVECGARRLRAGPELGAAFAGARPARADQGTLQSDDANPCAGANVPTSAHQYQPAGDAAPALSSPESCPGSLQRGYHPLAGCEETVSTPRTPFPSRWDSAGVTVPGPRSLTLDHSTLRTWTSWLVPREPLLTQPRGTVLVA